MLRLDDEKMRLAEESVERAKRITKRYAKLFPEHADDFMSSALWGAVRAASEYEPDWGTTWMRWSTMLIKHEIHSFLRSASLRKANQRAGIKTLQREYSPEFVEDHDSDNVEQILGLLPVRYSTLMRLIYVNGMTASDAGQMLGMTGNCGCKIHKRALAILKRRVA